MIFTILIEWHVLIISWLDVVGFALFAYSCHASILIIINFELFLSLGAMINFDAIVTSIVAIIMNYHINKFDTCTPSNRH
jgi:hypothetical protein